MIGKDVCDLSQSLARGRFERELLSRVLPIPDEEPTVVQAAPELPPLVYEEGSIGYKSWMILNKAGNGWVRVDERSAHHFVRRHLGIESEAKRNDYLSEVQQERNVFYSGPLSGYSAGIHEISGVRVLVTESPTFLTPEKGDWSVIRELIEDCWFEGDKLQIDTLHAYTQRAVRGAMGLWQDEHEARELKLGHILFLVGPPRSGKNVWQEQIFTKLLGQRERDPYSLLISRDGRFNAHIMEVGHLKFSDKAVPADYHIRCLLQERVKEQAADLPRLLERKNGHPITVENFRRVTASINEEDQHIALIPYTDTSFLDKFIVLKVNRKMLPITGAELGKAISGELPHYLHWLLYDYQPPYELTHDEDGLEYRFGVKAYQHPEIMERLIANSREAELKDMIVDAMESPESVWKVGDLYKRLSEGKHGPAFRGMYRSPDSLGRALNTLSEQYQGFVTRDPSHKKGRRVTINTFALDGDDF